jgi:hypothetical protein
MSDEDPEVVADRQLRAYTEASRPGLTETQFAARIREVAKPSIVGVVPCRNRCGSVVDWTEEAEHAFEVSNRELERQNEPQLDKTKIVFCPACVARGRSLRADGNRKHVDVLAEKIRALKETDSPDEERELIKQIEKLNHPDVPGLLGAIAEKRSKGRRIRKSDIL